MSVTNNAFNPQLINVSTPEIRKSLPWILFICVAMFFFFEAIQMSYFDIIAPYFINHHWYSSNQIGALSAAYYYGNVLGVIPAGQALDNKNIRSVMLLAITLSVLAAFILAFTNQFLIGWIARFICGFFGGAYCFLGGAKVLAQAFQKRFTLAIGLFITAGMLAGMVAQLPILWVMTWTGISGVMLVVSMLGLCVLCINFYWLHPEQASSNQLLKNKHHGWIRVLSEWRNYSCGLMISAINTPVSILGNLWGVLVLTHLYHFSDTASASIMMLLFLGLMVGSPLMGELADRYKITTPLMYIGCLGSMLIMGYLTVLGSNLDIYYVGLCFLILGILSSCQTLVYAWIKQNNDMNVISRAMALNSIILMGMSGLVKQISTETMQLVAWFGLKDSVDNILIMIGISMMLAALITTTVKRRNQEVQ